MAILTILLSGITSLFSFVMELGKKALDAPGKRMLRRMAYVDRRELLLGADDGEFPGLAWALCDLCTFLRQDARAWRRSENQAFIERWFANDAIEQQIFAEEPWQYFKPETIAAIKADLVRTSFPD
jgi:hypothetical protein